MTQTAETEKALVKLQAVAGLLFFVFLVMHLGNTLLAPLGPDHYNATQRVLQKIYQQPVLELGLVILPLISHSAAGVWLFIIRRRRRLNRPLKHRLQTWAGLFLLLVVIGHALATRGVGYWFDAVPGFEGVAFSLWWMPGYFYPYYFLLFMAGLYHGTAGAMQIAGRRFGRTLPAVRRWLPVGYLIAALWVLGVLFSFGGHVFDIADPRDSDYARQYSEFFDIDLERLRAD